LAKLINNLKSLGAKRLISMGVVFVAVMAIISAVTYFATRPDMITLYAGMDPADAGQAIAELEGANIPVQATNNGTALLVPKNMKDNARILLAQKGLPATPGVGYELFDKADGFGLTTFMQRVNRLRAMEGELGRTISSLDGVESSRVHLVLPDRESFSRTAPEPSASVVVHMKGSRALETPQARAIRHLVAAAVPALKPTAVTIADAAGNVILTEGEAPKAGTEARTSIETKIQKSVEDLLVARLGNGNVRVSVTAEIETAREVRRRQEFDPNGRVVRSTQTVEDKQRASDNNGDNATTVQQNIPNADLLSGGPTSPTASTSDRNEETVNYEITNEVIERVIEPGDLRKVAVAVLVNGSYSTSEDGSRSYQPRTPEEINSLENLIKTAMGFNETRGDQVSIESLQFAEIPTDETPTVRSTVEILAENSGTIIMWFMIALMVTLIFIFVVRPLMAMITTNNSINENTSEPVLDIPAPTSDEPAVSINMSSNAEQAARDDALNNLQVAVDENIEQAITVLRSWIQEG
jgi:flagellar M-ring protein FliF